MRKKQLLGIILIVFAVLVGWYFFFATEEELREAEVSNEQVFEIPVTEWDEYWTSQVSSEDIPSGNPFDRIDPTQLGAALDEEGTTSIAKEDAYHIVYYDMDSSVFITLNKKPLVETRKQAEQAFLQKFGLQKAEACRITVVLNTTKYVDPLAAGRDYGLSFCPDGKPLPQE